VRMQIIVEWVRRNYPAIAWKLRTIWIPTCLFLWGFLRTITPEQSRQMPNV
jgi:hypothetical protein